jgi:hypothetical protein
MSPKGFWFGVPALAGLAPLPRVLSGQSVQHAGETPALPGEAHRVPGHDASRELVPVEDR